MRKPTIDYSYLDDDEEVPDGGSVRVRTFLMDGQPHFAELTDEIATLRRQTRDSYVKELTTAWKRSPPPASPRPEPPRRNPSTARDMVRGADAEARRNTAYQKYCDNLQNAWKTGRTDPTRAAAIEEQAEGENWRHGA